jgi:hypothetical protein
MSKYAPLRDHLMAVRADRWHATFREIEDVLGFPLPQSAYKYPAWWANEDSGRHVQRMGWCDAGFLTENLNLLGRKIPFVRARRWQFTSRGQANGPRFAWQPG